MFKNDIWYIIQRTKDLSTWVNCDCSNGVYTRKDPFPKLLLE